MYIFSILVILLTHNVNVLKNTPRETVFEIEFEGIRPHYEFVALPGNPEIKIETQVLESEPPGGEGKREIASIKARGKLREVPLAVIELDPLLNIDGKTYLVRKALVTLNYVGGKTYNYEVSRSFVPIYKNLFINSCFINFKTRDAQESLNGARYLIICGDDFVDELEPLKEWKTEKGMYARVVPLSVTGYSSSDIKAYIEDAYYNWDVPPEYVLLVGDLNIIPSPSGDNDHYYAMLDADEFDDVVIGRLPAEDETDVNTMVSKILGYEKTPYLADTTWFKKGVVIVREDGDDDDTIYWNDAKFAAQKMVEAGYIHVDTFSYFNNDDHYDVENAITDGRTYVLFRGEGVGNWWSPFDLNPSNCHNGFKLPIILSITCSTLGDDDLGENSMKAGTPENPQCAVGFIGSTTIRVAVAHIRSYIARGFFMALFDDSIFHLGEALDRARLFLYENLGNDPDFTGFALLGDPELNLWTDSPRELNVTHPPFITPGQTEVTIHVDDYVEPVEGALVCLMTDTFHYYYGYTGDDGNLTLSVNFPDTGQVLMTVTAYNFKPKSEYIPIGTEGPYVTLESADLEEITYPDGNPNPGETALIDIVLKNYGTETAYNVQTELSLTDGHAVLIDSTQYIGTILSQDSVRIDSAFSFTVLETAEDGESVNFLLKIYDSNGDTWTSYIVFTVSAVKIEFGNYTIIDTLDGNSNGIPESGETFQFFPYIKNTGGMRVSNLTVKIENKTLSPLFNILDGMTQITNLGSGDSTMVRNDPFEISIHHLAPPNYRAQLRVIASGDAATYSYIDTFNFILTINPPNIHHPSGPDSYGYYVFDNTDIFPQAPQYDWIEIAPPQGPGTIIPEITDSDADTVTIPLPFTFKFYGIEYDSIGVCSNGFLELGKATYRFGYNTSIPSPGGPRRLLAPFWCDLNPYEGGDVYKYYDSTNHRFIIEFKDVVHYGTSDNETFEIILLDPNYYLTPTGDGEIIFQYNTVSDPSECTIGIEDHTETVGLQYLYNGDLIDYGAPIQSGRAILFTTRNPYVNPYPWMTLNPQYLIVDSIGGNGNGVLETGETAELYVSLPNQGSAPIQGAIAILISQSASIVVVDSFGQYGSIPPQGVSFNFDPFIISVAQISQDTAISLTMRVLTEMGTFLYPLTLNVYSTLNSWEMSEATSLLPEVKPVPAKDNVEITFGLPKKERVSIDIFDIAGRKRKTLLHRILAPGIYVIRWDGRDAVGRKVSSGIYFLRFRAGKISQVRRIVFINN